MNEKSQILTHPAMLAHEPGLDCLEVPERLERLLASEDLSARIVEVGRRASIAELETVHSPDYVRRVLAMRGKTGSLDVETILSPLSVDAALHATGVALELVDHLLDGRFVRGFAAVRPPGHHAGVNAGGGYCVFNNVALAAAGALARGARPVLIVDWDVHHGNGTQEIFWKSPDVIFIDIHQDDCFPIGSGAASERGLDFGRGTTINVPVPPGLEDADYAHILRAVVDAVAEVTCPALVLVSAGFDAHDNDPHGDESLSPAGFAAMTTALRDVADRHAHGRLGLVLEGGYGLSALVPCVRACIDALDGAVAQIANLPSDLARKIADDAVRGALDALPSTSRLGENGGHAHGPRTDS